MLAIGLVVDDAIVVVENIHRHIEEGMTPYDAAIQGAREITGPVIAMTITLAAVYAPIGFTSGLTGALFREFAFTLAGAVIVSGVIALTLSPMMTSKMLKPHDKEGWFGLLVERVFGSIQRFYRRRLDGTIKQRSVFAWVAVLTVVSVRRSLQRHQPRAGASRRPGRAVCLHQRAGTHQPRLSDDLYRPVDRDLHGCAGAAEPLRHQWISDTRMAPSWA